MSLVRFINSNEILQSRTRLEGITLRPEDLDTISRDISILENISNQNILVEAHIYNTSGDYITSNYHTPFNYSLEYKDFSFDVATIFDDLNLLNGSYKISFSFLSSVFGKYNKMPLFLEEISPDRTELKLAIKKSYLEKHPEIIEELKAFKDSVAILKASERVNNLVVNFRENQIFQIVNIKVECNDDYAIYVKLYEPLSDSIAEKKSSYICFKVLEDYVDSFLLRPKTKEPEVTVIGPPDFDIIDDIEISSETDIKYWDNLLDTNTSTTNRIIREIFSGSAEIPLNIDWSDFNNFIVYGSATERLKNYKYKMELVEYYYSQKASILNSNASGSNSVTTLVGTYTKRTEALLGELDQFERFLYYHTGSLFSYDITGSVTPHPKYENQGQLINWPTTSSAYINWYNTLLEDATEFDRTNYSSFFYNTPDHILRDPNNSQYVLFIHMVGQHFDNIYAYVRELTAIHRRDEHPERGIPNKLLPFYARSLGWKLQNNKTLSDLWLYKLGTDQSGSMSVPTGSLVSRPHEVLSEQIWRRVVNNLPFLLKTKGTERSVRALFSIYGIPFTLISVKEYGGPAVDDDKANLIQDRFQYLLNFKGDRYVEVLRKLQIPTTVSTPQIPQTTEFRFKTNYTGSVSMSLWALEESNNRPNPLQNLEIVHYSGSLYGKNTYGYLKYTVATGSVSNFGYVVGTSSLLPLFDNDIWTVRMYAQQPIYQGSTFDGNVYIDVGKASDFIDGTVSLSSSFSIYATPNSLLYSMGAVATAYIISSSFENTVSTDFSTLFPTMYGIVSQVSDTTGHVIYPTDIDYDGSLVTIDFNSPETGQIAVLPGMKYTASFVEDVEEIINHGLGSVEIITQFINNDGNQIIPSRLRIVDGNNIGVTLATEVSGSLVIIPSGSDGLTPIDVQVFPFSIETQITQSNPYGTNTIIVQIFDNDYEQIIPQSLKLDGNIYIDFTSPEEGYIHVAKADLLDLVDMPHTIVIGGTTGSASSRFSGSMQAYKEYYDTYTKSIFDKHVLNPGGYFGNSYTSSFDGLFRYYPMGLDNLKHDHSIYNQVSSSHPNQGKLDETVATFVNFTGTEGQQYTNHTELYYMEMPSLGAHQPKSKKIRDEESYLIRQLSPDRKAEVSRYDREQNDSNRLAIVFSPTDQINRDIANQFGPYNFEDFIGDPEHGSKDYYPDLSIARDAYFKKYSRANDIGKYIEIFSLYDYAVFEQIKQLVPGRSNLIAGVLIEPTILERPKIKRPVPSIEILGKATTLNTRPKHPSGSYANYQTVLDPPIEVEIERSKNETTIENPLYVEIERSKNETTIENPLCVEIERSKNETTIVNPLEIEMTRDKYEGDIEYSISFGGNVHSLNEEGESLKGTTEVFKSKENTERTLPAFVYSGEAVEETISYTYKRDNTLHTITIVDNRYKNYQGIAEVLQEHLYSNVIYNNKEKAVGSFVVQLASINVDFEMSYLDSDNYVFYPNTIEPNITGSYGIVGTEFKDFLYRYNYEVFPGHNIIYRKINRGKYDMIYITGSRTYPEYQRKQKYYAVTGVFTSEYQRELTFAVSRSLDLYYSSSFENTNYQHFESSRLGGCRFEGSKLTGLGFNVDSTETISGGPVVTVTIVDDNSLII